MKDLLALLLPFFKKKIEQDFSNSYTLPGINWHEKFIPYMASILRPKVYVELGLYHCEVFNRIIPYAENLIGVDIEETAGKYMTVSEKTKFYCASTKEFSEIIRSSPIGIDLLFIDANHSKESVLEDFYNFFPFVIPHGLILLHDTHPGYRELTDPKYCGDAYKAISELAKNTSSYEIITIPVSPGLTLIRKRESQLSWMQGRE